VVICLERGADLHMAQLMPLPLTVSCVSKIQIGFTFLVPAHSGSPGKRAVKRARACACVCARVREVNRPILHQRRWSWLCREKQRVERVNEATQCDNAQRSLDDFHVVASLGRGTYGQVYKAVDSSNR